MAYASNTLSQQDPTWKNKKLGFSNRSIGADGCTLTCLAMLANGFGKTETPATLNEKLKALGEGNGFIGELVVWGGLPSLFPEFSLRKIIICRQDTQRAPLDEIDAALARGQAVLVELDQSPAAGIQNHWVVLYKKEGNDYLMNDPWTYPVDKEPTLLTPRYAAGRSLAKVITAVVWYEVAGTAPPLDDGMYVKVIQSASSGLRLRAQPTVASATLALEPAGSYLRLIEDEADAEAKIGVTGEWLHVRDLLGTEGYVAAWFVEAVEDTSSGDDDDEEENPSDDEPTNEEPPVDDPNDDHGEDDDSPEPPPPAEDLKIYVSRTVGDRGLRMRSRAGLGGALVTVVSATAELTVLENADTAKSKIGTDSEWIHVQIGAHEGYVAAWLVTFSLDEEPVDEPADDEPVDEPIDAPTDEPSEDDEPVTTPGLKVYVVPDVGSRGLRMRAQPSLGGSLVTTLSQKSELTSLEDADVTHTKVGTNGEWLHVQQGTREGYVAAWLVTFSLDEDTTDVPVDEPTDPPVDEPSPPETPEAAPLTVTVFPSLGRNGLRMRAEPNLRGSLVGILAGGTQLTVLDNPTFATSKVGSYGQWLHVAAPTGREGYVAAWYVNLDETNVHTPPPSTLIVYVTPLARGGLRMRKGPSTGYRIVKTLKANSALTVLENEEEAIAKIGATGEWLHVRDEAGVEGYVAAWYIVR